MSPLVARACDKTLRKPPIEGETSSVIHPRVLPKTRFFEDWQGFLKELIVLTVLTTAFVSNKRWAARLKEANAGGSVILRYSLMELAVIFTMLCVVAAVFAAIFQQGNTGWG